MRRRRATVTSEAGQEFGSDSFLDVVTNVVGILIILVVVVGLRVKQAPAHAPAVLAEPADDLAPLEAEALALREDLARLNDEIDGVDRETEVRHEERAALAYLVETGQRELNTRRQQLGAEAQQLFDLRRAVALSDDVVERLSAELAAAQGEKQEPVVIETYPTPIASIVTGEERHFYLRAGLVTPIPLEPLLEQCRADAKSQMWKLKNQPRFSGVVGPVGGFRLRYELERVEIAFEGGARMAAYAQLSQWELEPIGALGGETAAEALERTSEFRQAVARLVPRKTTVTLWTYPDSFALYRELKRELFHQGFATAGRPLPYDVPIGGSPDGSRSTAQ